MRKFFKAKLKYVAENENGILVNQTHEFLVDAVSYTEAEALMYAHASETVRGEFTVDSLVKTNLTDVFDSGEGYPYWQGKVQYFVTDTDSGQEKQVTNNMVVTATTPEDALNSIRQALSNMLVGFEINGLVRTKIEEVIKPLSVTTE